MSNVLNNFKKIGIVIGIVLLIPLVPILIDIVFTLGQFIGSEIRYFGVC